MGTDWFVKVECPHPNEEIENEEERIKACKSCPYVIWERPESVATFWSTMCGVRVGNIRTAAELDDIGRKLTGTARFTKEETSSSQKLAILEKIKKCAEEEGWRLPGFSKKETLERIEFLIEFCKRAEKKELTIHAWA